MSRSLQIVCDGCGKQKQESNHWWVAGVARSQAIEQRGPMMLLAPFDFNEQWDERFQRHDLCGQDCALKFISEQMGKARGETTNDAK